MKIKSVFIFSIFIAFLTIIYVNYKVANSSYYQAFLMYDFNADAYNVPYEQYMNKLDDNFPNLTHTALPIKFVKARYLIKIDSIDQAKKLLHKAAEENPFIKGPEEMLARIFLDEENIDSAYFFSKEAFDKMPNVNPHRWTFFRVLQKMNDSIGLDNAFDIIKNRSEPAHWYDYIYTKFKLNNQDTKLTLLIDEFKETFPNESTGTIDEILNFINIGSEAYTLSTALTSLGDNKFSEKKYIEAAAFYEKAIDFNQDQYLNFENAAISYDLSNNYEKALEYYDLVINTFKTLDGRSEFYKGLMLIRNNNPIEGCQNLEVASIKKFILKNDGISALNVFKGLCQKTSNN